MFARTRETAGEARALAHAESMLPRPGTAAGRFGGKRKKFNGDRPRTFISDFFEIENNVLGHIGML